MSDHVNMHGPTPATCPKRQMYSHAPQELAETVAGIAAVAVPIRRDRGQKRQFILHWQFEIDKEARVLEPSAAPEQVETLFAQREESPALSWCDHPTAKKLNQTREKR